MDSAIIVAVIGSVTTIAVALIERSKEKKPKKTTSGTPSTSQATAPPSRSRFVLILLLGLSITANAVLFSVVKPLSKPAIVTSNPEAVPPVGTTPPTVKRTGDTVEISAPPGNYVSGISFSVQSGGAHGQVYSVSPLYKPFPPRP